MRFQTIFISDTHLGGVCNYSALLNFLKTHDADVWFIVGDFLGLWEVSRSKSWPIDASTVIQKILKKARHGQKFIILPGNHDSELHRFCGFELGNITIVDKTVFNALDGKKFLVLHGDAFDPVIGKALWLSKLGSTLYDFLVILNMSLNWIRKLFGIKFWSFSKMAKSAVKESLAYIGDYEETLVELARQSRLDGVICGHIHTPKIEQFGEICYINTGDWVESLSAVVEHLDGKIELIHYDEH